MWLNLETVLACVVLGILGYLFGISKGNKKKIILSILITTIILHIVYTGYSVFREFKIKDIKDVKIEMER